MITKCLSTVINLGSPHKQLSHTKSPFLKASLFFFFFFKWISPFDSDIAQRQSQLLNQQTCFTRLLTYSWHTNIRRAVTRRHMEAMAARPVDSRQSQCVRTKRSLLLIASPELLSWALGMMMMKSCGRFVPRWPHLNGGAGGHHLQSSQTNWLLEQKTKFPRRPRTVILATVTRLANLCRIQPINRLGRIWGVVRCGVPDRDRGFIVSTWHPCYFCGSPSAGARFAFVEVAAPLVIQSFGFLTINFGLTCHNLRSCIVQLQFFAI